MCSNKSNNYTCTLSDYSAEEHATDQANSEKLRSYTDRI